MALPGIDPHQLLTYVIRPTLKRMRVWTALPNIDSPGSESLLLGVAAVESECGRWLHQIGGGPAAGPWQMEPVTAMDLYESAVGRYGGFSSVIHDFLPHGSSISAFPAILPVQLDTACMLARLHFLWRSPEAMPQPGDYVSQARIWKQHYNTLSGAGTLDGYVEAWRAHVAPVADKEAWTYLK